MKCLLCLTLLIGIALAAGTDDVLVEHHTKKTTTTLEPTTSTTERTTTMVTTPTTTTEKPTTTTPTTTTEQPTTTTKPTTTKPTTTKPTTTTETPTTTTTVAPDTTTTSKPTPTPAPGPKAGNWAWSDPKTNKTCVIVKMAVQFNVTFVNKENKTVTNTVSVPPTANVTGGSCEEQEQFLGLIWPSKNATRKPNSMRINFVKNTTTHFFTLNKVNVFLDNAELPGFPQEFLGLNYTGSDIKAPLTKSYHCTRVQKFNMTEGGSELLSQLDVSDLQVEAFHDAASHDFSEAADCDGIDTPDVVPVAVGCALAALVIIVLVAYLVGRRRSQARGYLSM